MLPSQSSSETDWAHPRTESLVSPRLGGEGRGQQQEGVDAARDHLSGCGWQGAEEKAPELGNTCSGGRRRPHSKGEMGRSGHWPLHRLWPFTV